MSTKNTSHSSGPLFDPLEINSLPVDSGEIVSGLVTCFQFVSVGVVECLVEMLRSI